ncbi:ABC-type sugar transport system ATPase subunit [Rhizobium sp. OAE497]
MANLVLENVRKSFGALEVIPSINLDIKDGEFVVFVGPSGCGKSTLLRMIAGLEETTGGDIRIDGGSVIDTPAADRGVAMVFQSYALYPHMTVRQNLSFGLENIHMPKEEINKRVEAAGRLLQIDTLLERRPRQLSGGQRQRVAIGRAITRDPKIFLFDEPLSNLDAELRVLMRVEITKLHERLGNTMIYVTHDQIEAMTMADKIVVLRKGVVEQVGAPLELYNKPRNTFVAGFIGSPRMNPDRREDHGVRRRLRHLRRQRPSSADAAARHRPSRRRQGDARHPAGGHHRRRHRLADEPHRRRTAWRQQLSALHLAERRADPRAPAGAEPGRARRYTEDRTTGRPLAPFRRAGIAHRHAIASSKAAAFWRGTESRSDAFSRLFLPHEREPP